MKRFPVRTVTAICASCLLITQIQSADAAVMISQNGSAYTSISASSEFSGDYTADNLFDEIPVVGVQMVPFINNDIGIAWAGNIAENYSHYVEFQLDQSYQIDSLMYAQREYNNLSSVDKVSIIKIWAGSSPFTPANPGGSPDVTVSITNQTNDTFVEYALSNAIYGQYFLLHVSNPSYSNSPSKGVIGGAELRFGGAAAPAPVPEPSMLLILPILALAAPFAVRAFKAIGSLS